MITFAGVPLLLEDPEGRIQAWLDRYYCLDDVRLFGAQPAALRDGRHRPRGYIGRAIDPHTGQLPPVGPDGARVGLPTLNWSAMHPPRIRLNTLWWPTGASRWAQGFFLADRRARNEITTLLDGNKGTLVLETTDPVGRTVSLDFQMYLLPPLPISDVETETALYLLPLVDQRYYWQWRDPGALDLSGSPSWATVFGLLAAALGVEIEGGGTSFAYPPDPIEFTRRYENAALLLDAAAACCGARIVARRDGKVLSLRFSESYDTLWETLHETIREERIAGGQADTTAGNYYATSRPAAVRVVYARASDGVPLPDGSVYVKTFPVGAGTGVKTIFETALADFTGNPPTPRNDSCLTGLGEAIASVWIAYQQPPHHYTLPGLVDWPLTGLDDWVWWHVGTPSAARSAESDIEYQCYTRVAGMPINTDIEEMCHFCPMGTTTTTPGPTTTTGEPTTTTTRAPCEGDCVWRWNDATKRWILQTRTCPDHCPCQQPQFCGETDGETTRTDCSQHGGPPQPDCGGPTTTGEPTTTTESPTTTTEEPPSGCTLGCDWIWNADSRGTWTLLSTACAEACPCSPPSEDGTYDCQVSHTPCVVATSSTTTTVPPECEPPCRGWCGWVWVSDIATWRLVENGCSPVSGCICDHPSIGAPYNCEIAWTPCWYGLESVPEPETVLPPQQPKSISGGTCYGACKWRWDGHGWVQMWDTCHAICPCSAPAYNGSSVHETAMTRCGLVGTGTTTTETPTTAEGPCLPCVWLWDGERWSRTGPTSQCQCEAPEAPGRFPGDLQTLPANTTPMPACSGNCVWTWWPLGRYWSLVRGTECWGDCNCSPPGFIGGDAIETRQTPCTTSTTGAPCGMCLYTWNATEARWERCRIGCTGDCTCPHGDDVPGWGQSHGQLREIPCSSTTTTAAPTSTTSGSTTTTTEQPTTTTTEQPTTTTTEQPTTTTTEEPTTTTTEEPTTTTTEEPTTTTS